MPECPNAADLLERILSGDSPCFALLHRPGTAPGSVEILSGEVSAHEELAELPVTEGRGPGAGPRHDLLVAVPYQQISERGFDHVPDDTPLVALEVREQAEMPLSEALPLMPDTGIRLRDRRFDIDDASYAETARRVIEEEIGGGEGSNFVLKRSFMATIDPFSRHSAITLFRRLLENESGAYWTFVLHTPEHTLVGASPEQHVGLQDGRAKMNPISGTYRYPTGGPTLSGVLDFLDDQKETEELYMVVDEELKMMARICGSPPHVTGPRLKEMSRLAHTEYLIEGPCDSDPRDVLRATMFAPTVTGSPLENACRVIARHEREGRGYYSGALALIGQDAHGRDCLDSAIMIRTAQIEPSGRTRICVGATLVRDSEPGSEVAETHAKSAGVLAALETDHKRRLGDHPQVRAALDGRNEPISRFWLSADRGSSEPEQTGLRALVVDAEDTFTAMLAHQLEALGLAVSVRRFDEDYSPHEYDLTVLGPGPGDPRDIEHPKIARMRTTARALLEKRHPFVAVCLSHQVLSLELGLEVTRRDRPNQGVQHEIDFFSRKERVGFYNTFAAQCAEPWIGRTRFGPVEVSRDPLTREVHGLRGQGFGSVQFHTESLLTRDGVAIMGGLIEGTLAGRAVPG
ncbi:phenazine-specific anthranilate synthase component I [Nocardiopsis kunsanensis]|uniref:anthranilate synthase n=1 Tax=Nocardiopsis kunsanensis TaxID=141693 RepID=A0A919CF99_9ACTN|nr:anthranilate synthase family protein [Nocardiopsis kunsanensis]GHD17659.1 phenazine-specific anthranilate synthase component I [Nocardiopsis kunsanensis]